MSVNPPEDYRSGAYKTRKFNKVPLVKDCWYDIPYVWLEVLLRIIALMAIFFFLAVLIHLTLGQIPTFKSFNTFLEHAHLITDATELGILAKATKEEGLYSAHEEKADSDLKERHVPRMRNTTKMRDLPLEIYKGTDDEDAYFVTFREQCDEKLSQGYAANEVLQKKPKNFAPKHKEHKLLGVELGMNDDGSWIKGDTSRFSSDGDSELARDANLKKSQLAELLSPNFNSYKLDQYRGNSPATSEDENVHKFGINLHQTSLHSKPEMHNLPESHPRMKKDLASITNTKVASKPTVGEETKENEDLELDGISLEEENMEVADAVRAKNYLKNKINNEIENKENEIIERLEGMGNIDEMDGIGWKNATNSDPNRHPRDVDINDKSLTYTEHERSLKQDVAMTYRRAQDIAKTILKSSEALASSLDLCRKPISTNFISDEPLTEAEDVIEQIVVQLKDSLELSMGCRTCVKPHKDLMIFLRWLVFDDSSVKLCPSKPKAANLRKNYLLFNHDNMFPGRVCNRNEFPKAPSNCSCPAGEEADQDPDEKKRAKSTISQKNTPFNRRHYPNNVNN